MVSSDYETGWAYLFMYTLCRHLSLAQSNNTMINKCQRIKKKNKEMVLSEFRLVSRHLAGENHENHRCSYSG